MTKAKSSEHGWEETYGFWIHCKCGWRNYSLFDSWNNRQLRKHLEAGLLDPDQPTPWSHAHIENTCVASSHRQNARSFGTLWGYDPLTPLHH